MRCIFGKSPGSSGKPQEWRFGKILTGGVIKTLPEIASKFFFTSSRCELPYQLPLLISLRSGIKSQSIVETIFLTFYGRNMKKVIVLFLLFLCANSFSEEITDGYKRSSENQPSEQMTRLPLIRNTANLKNTSGYEFLAW